MSGVDELRAQVEALRVRTDQLAAVSRLDWDMQDAIAGLGARLDRSRIDAHVLQAIDRAPLEFEPFPHVVVSDWLPDDVYKTMLEGLPPAIFFADRPVKRQRLVVPFELAPVYSKLVWNFVADEIVAQVLCEALSAKFDGVMREMVRSMCGGGDGLDWKVHPSDGRIMLRRPGYLITPHRDPKWGFVTGLIYLARPGDNEAHGTQLYRVRDDEEAPNDKPLWVDESRCELVRSVPYRANTLLAFLNSSGAHGASIPADAQPADLERYVYQFRLGPDRQSVKVMLASMTDDGRARWSGDKALKAGLTKGPPIDY
jgi:hypothetical protein